MKLNDGIQMARVDYDEIQLGGGWDQMTPSLKLKSGVIRDSSNYECSVTGGYTRVAGYERYDGRAAPSDASYAVLYVNAFTNIPAVGNTITGAAATATCIAVTTTYIVVTKQTGAYMLGETLLIGGVTAIGTYVIPAGAIPASLAVTYTYLASQVYRTLIEPVGGAAGYGTALGCVLYNDVLYGFRATAADHTKVGIYKSSGAGWVNVPLYNELSFTSGVSALAHPQDGDTITQGGVSALIKRVVAAGGAWGTDAVGRFIVVNPTGGNFAAGAATVGGAAFPVTLSGAQTPIVITAGGVYEFETDSFVAGSNVVRVYGCDGVNRGFEFDGLVYVPITTGAVPDTPKYVEVHKNYLFFSIKSSLLFSAPGLPYNFTALSGAGEIGIAGDVTGIKVMPGAQTTAAMLVTARNNTYMLYGVGASTPGWNLVSYNTGAGSIDHTVQNMSDAYVADDRGVVSLVTTLNYGNFDQSTLTANINTFIASRRGKYAASSLCRRKSQYRVFFTDGIALYITVVNQQLLGSTKVVFPNPVYMAWEGKYSSGDEAAFFCSSSGYVYQMEKGTSFDGLSIDAYFTLVPNFIRSPRLLKRFRRASAEVYGQGYSQFSFGYSLGYVSPNITQPTAQNYNSATNAVFWDSFAWDNFIWDGVSTLPNEIEMSGTGENVSITIRSGTPYYQSYTINSIILHYSKRRAMR